MHFIEYEGIHRDTSHSPCFLLHSHWLGKCRSRRIDALEYVTEAHKAIFGLGDGRKCPTVTANAKMLSKARSQGVHLMGIVHHAIWLTGI
jgi:hypothetical protein